MIDKRDIARLLESARDVRKRAYAPYSNFKVGASVLTPSGDIYVGANIENASFPAGVCAECSAVTAAVSNGERSIVAVCIVTKNKPPVAPCGVCRQMLAEFGPTMSVLLAHSEEGEIASEHSLSDLLPGHFNGDDLR